MLKSRALRFAAFCLTLALASSSAPLAAIDKMECTPGHIITIAIDGQWYSACIGLEEPVDCLKCYVTIEVP
jgi:hypothetical protein